MKKYFISEFEQSKVTEILKQLEKIERKEKIEELEKVYYIYHELGKIYSENSDFVLADPYIEYQKKEAFYQKETTEDGKAVCVHMSKTFAEALLQIGIEAKIVRESENGLPHVDVVFKTKDGNVYLANLIQDILRIQTGMRIRSFGTPNQILEANMIKQGRLPYLKRLERDYGKLTEVSQERIEEMDYKFGFNQKKIYTEDVLKMLKDEIKDQKRIEEFFETRKIDELVEKKIDFAMNMIGIANKHGKEKIGYREGIQYYGKLAQSLLTEEEQKYIRVFFGYRMEYDQKKPETIIIVIKEKENKYYRYDEEEKKFIKANDAEKIKSLDIKYDVMDEEEQKKKTKKVNDTIERLEERFKEAEERNR